MPGGSAPSVGIRFQDNVAAWVAVQILADSSATPPANLPAGVRLESITAETTQPTDDLHVRTSDQGHIFIQAKTNPSLSSAENSEFRAVVDQFVRQFLQGCPEGTGTRPLDASRDRLLFVVSQNAPGTIRNHLSELFHRLRLVNVDMLPEVVAALNQSLRGTYDTVRALIVECFTKHSDQDPSDEQILTLMRLCHVITLDVGPSGGHLREADQLLRNAVLHDPENARDAWNAIVQLCRDFSPGRTGAHRDSLRSMLIESGMTLEPPRSYQSDIHQAKRYTSERLAYLQQHATIPLDAARKHQVKINRRVQAELVAVARGGHTLVVGVPGAGKSGCVHDAAQELSKEADTLVIPVDRIEGASGFKAELGLLRAFTLAELLSNWSGPGPAYLFVDALDAARTRGSLQRLCDELREISERAPRWRVVASIREFDLQNSREVQNLFKGEPHPDLRSRKLGNVRHVKIPLLDDCELAAARAQSPSLDRVLGDANTQLVDLVRNLFNLRLLAELAEEASEEAVGALTTQLQLLDLYWAKRTGDVSAASRSSLLNRLVTVMKQTRQLVASKQSLLYNTANEAPCLHELLSDGLIIETEAPIAGADQDISFAHNILFDYAVARVWARDLPIDVVDELCDVENEDLLLALRPSLNMAFARLWHEPEQPTRDLFWQRAFEFQRTRLIGRIIPAVVAAAEFRTCADFLPLIEALAEPDSAASSILRYSITAALMLDEDADNSYRVLGRENGEWMELALQLAKSSMASTFWQVRTILVRAVLAPERLTAQERVHAGSAARLLLIFALSEQRNDRVLGIAVHAVSLTAETEPRASIEVLNHLLAPDQVESIGYMTLGDMTEHFEHLFRADHDFAMQLASVVFSTYSTRDEQVPTGGKIISLNFNKRDMLDIARSHVADGFPSVMSGDPIAGTRMAGRILAAHAKHEPFGVYPDRTVEFEFAGGMAVMRPDGSQGWVDRSYNQNEAWYKVLHAFKSGIQDAAAQQPPRVGKIVEAFIDSFELAAGWQTLIEAGAGEPKHLGLAIQDLLTVPAILTEEDTRVAAGNLIRSLYPLLSDKKRLEIETTIGSLGSESAGDLPDDYIQMLRDRMMGCIPLEYVVTPATRQRLDELTRANAVPPNTPLWTHGVGTPTTEEWFAGRGIDIRTPQNQAIRDLTEQVKRFAPHNQPAELLIEEISAFLPTMRELSRQVNDADTLAIDATLGKTAHEELIDCTERIARFEGLASDAEAYQFIRSTLLRAATDPLPQPLNSEEQWDSQQPSWSPAPRIAAAAGLMALVLNSATRDDEVQQAIKILLVDSHPAVRYQIVHRLIWMWNRDRALMWSLIDEVALREQRLTIIDTLTRDVLLRLGGAESDRVGQYVLNIYKNVRRNPKAGNLRKAATIHILRRAVWHDDGKCARRLTFFCARPLQFESELRQIISWGRDLLVYDEDTRDAVDNERVRKWAATHLLAALTSILREMRELRNQHSGGEPWSEEATGQLRVLHSLADKICHQVYFASGAQNEKQGHAEGVLSQERLARFAEEVDPLMELLCEVEFVDISFDLLKTLQYIAPTNPRRTLQLIGKLVAHAATDGIQYESLAVDRIVATVEEYLAQHRDLLREREPRVTLLTILDFFVEAGWPKAARLTTGLSKVFR